jgi:hypothetical protein
MNTTTLPTRWQRSSISVNNKEMGIPFEDVADTESTPTALIFYVPYPSMRAPTNQASEWYSAVQSASTALVHIPKPSKMSLHQVG